jgi:PKD repeat protein
MEVNVMIENVSDIQKLHFMGFDYEPSSADGTSVRMYLVPEELKQLQNSHLRYQVTIPDLNRHFEHFWDNPLVPPGYYTYDQIIAIADSLASNFPSICKKVIWGTSMGGRQLAALKISDNAGADETEAEIMFDGGIHGDEIGGSQNVIMFARDLCLGYGADPTITDLINNREIWLYLMVNPDGRVAMSRYNNNGVDCNRDNGYMWNGEGNSWGAFSQVETKALRNGILDNQFVVYTNFHSGIEILAYPWSYRTDPTRDNEHINQMAGVYANASGYSNFQYGQGYNIMYAINGSTKDFQYGSLGNIGWSIEISSDKQPPSSQISYYYNANKPAMLAIINQCGWGISGMVTDSVTGEPVRASIWVNNYFPVYTDPLVGDYHKYLTPGTYTVKVVANGYQSKTVTNVIVPGQGTAVVNVHLAPASNHFAYKVMSCRIPGNNFGDEGFTPGSLGQPDGIPYSLGKNGWIVLDMGDTIFNGAGVDFKVIQSGTPAKEFTVSGGNNMDGPFTTIGVGTGTTSFDLNTVSLNKVRYLYVKDNGAGSAYGTGAGFNLDAIEMITQPLIVNFTASTISPCTGEGVNFTDISSGNPTTWSWSFPGGTPSSSNLQNPSNIHYDTPGTYNVSLTASNGITSGTKTKTGFINVGLSPVVNLGNDTSLCAWNTILLDAGNPGGTWLWSTGATTQTILADSSGIGYGSRNFWVKVTNSTGCETMDTIRITFQICDGIEEVGVHPTVTVFPNPSDGHFMIDICGFEGGSWQLYSMDGSLVKQSGISLNKFISAVNVSEIRKGIYLLKVQKGDTILLKKIILQKPMP